MEVTSLDAAGQARVIDRFESSEPKNVTLITSDKGDPIGLVQYLSTTEGSDVSARALVTVYLAAGEALLKRVGEFQCQKSPNEGPPRLKVENALWDSRNRELIASVQASCTLIDFYGAVDSQLLNFSGIDLSLAKNFPTTEESARIAIEYDADGHLERAVVDNAERRSARQCVEMARTSGSFAVCGPNASQFTSAVWPIADGNVKTGWECASHKVDYATGKDITILACDESEETGDEDDVKSDKKRIQFELMARGMPEASFFELECSSCKLLEVGRLAFAETERTLSFNIETDAAEIKFEGKPLKLDSVAAGVAVQVPILQVQFNQDWQLTQASWAGTVATGKETASDQPPPADTSDGKSSAEETDNLVRPRLR